MILINDADRDVRTCFGWCENDSTIRQCNETLIQTNKNWGEIITAGENKIIGGESRLQHLKALAKFATSQVQIESLIKEVQSYSSF